MGFPILVRWHLYIESRPRCQEQGQVIPSHTCCGMYLPAHVLVLAQHCTATRKSGTHPNPALIVCVMGFTTHLSESYIFMKLICLLRLRRRFWSHLYEIGAYVELRMTICSMLTVCCPWLCGGFIKWPPFRIVIRLINPSAYWRKCDGWPRYHFCMIIHVALLLTY